ncbi:putative fatty acyl-CoA reductase CG5065 [Oppia nitens]|uniref:putative fatty acyl-CoA reductase CG5065 n=1 Tax=Oppia nitens TaxID=1686743 RepID=UPI0023DB7129|nr:putative fatty acyl-CoA reductase CG5065 [Oppia nitens]
MTSFHEFFGQKSVLITGASGFVGKVLLFRLLRECLQIKAIYILLRPKAGQTAEKRANLLLSLSLFDPIRRQSLSQLDKVIPVCGDVTLDDLGLNALDKSILQQNVNIVFHSAATVRFDEPLRRALQLNLQSTERVLRLCLSLVKLDAFVHVSTAYCTRDKSNVLESVEDWKSQSARRLLDAAQWMDDSALDAIARRLVGDHFPSTYHITKCLSEQLLVSEGRGLPLAIIRPSIIGAALSEPSNGWTDNYNGLSGFFVAAGKGVLRTLHALPDAVCDVIPVDLVANTCISAAVSVATRRRELPLVVNCTSGTLNAVTWRQIRDYSETLFFRFPSQELFRSPSVHLHTSRVIHGIHLLAEHKIPSFIVDLLFRSFGLKPILGKVYEKVNRSVSALEFFTTNEWHFRCEELLRLTSDPSFPIDVRDINWKSYFSDYVLGVRRHLLRESDDTLPDARRRIQRLYFWTQISKSFVVFCVFLKVVSFLRQKRQKLTSLLPKA